MSEVISILIVEDDEAIRMSLRQLLEFEGFTVQTAKEGRDALSQLKNKIPSLILLDLTMPVMDGWQMIAVLEGDSKLSKIPVIVTSAVSLVEKIPHAKAFIKKPIDIELLLEMIRLHAGREL